jgi:cytochrome b561
MNSVPRYHPILVSLHWLVAALIIAMLAFGFLVLVSVPSLDPKKISLLEIHMVVGMIILALMLLRLLVRLVTARPVAATAGNRNLDRLARASHYGFYVLVLLMVGSGVATAKLSGLTEIIWGQSSASVPSNLTAFPTLIAHRVAATVLVGLILLHVLAAFYHQFVKKDHLLSRMSIRRPFRTSTDRDTNSL